MIKHHGYNLSVLIDSVLTVLFICSLFEASNAFFLCTRGSFSALRITSIEWSTRLWLAISYNVDTTRGLSLTRTRAPNLVRWFVCRIAHRSCVPTKNLRAQVTEIFDCKTSNCAVPDSARSQPIFARPSTVRYSGFVYFSSQVIELDKHLLLLIFLGQVLNVTWIADLSHFKSKYKYNKKIKTVEKSKKNI